MNVETHIGQYKILQTLGAGGMGTVFLGEHLLLGRQAAIKTLLPSLSSHREIVDRFFNEARAISAISDPGVVQIFDFGYHVDGTAYIVMEYLEGESLATRLDRMGKLPLLEALRITRQLAASLTAAHARGIIHRDLKPGNIFLIRDPEAQGGERTKILDFGIAKLVSTPADLVTTQTGTMLGTPVYMSPEQCRGSGRIDHRSDIYSVGCVLFHMLTGVTPFDCDSVGDFIAAHLKDAPPRPSELAPGLPDAVDALVMRCLEKAPEDRFASMAELAAAVETVLAHISNSSTPVPLTREMRKSTPLGEGFKSEYDVNRNLRERVSHPSDRWFVNSQLPVPAAGLDTGDDLLPSERNRSGYQKIVLFAALALGLIGGLFGTSYLLGDTEQVVTPPFEVAASADPLEQRAVATTREDQPPPPAIDTDDGAAADEQLADDTAQTPVPAPTPAIAPPPPAPPTQVEKPERPHPARSKVRPRPRRAVESQPVTTPTESEDDLYESR